MDEQAGPGVFFNNSSGLPGGGSAKPPQAADVGGGEAARAHYSIPGILHFLQHEWARFEVERAQWDVERAELQVSGLSLGVPLSDGVLFASCTWSALRQSPLADVGVEAFTAHLRLNGPDGVASVP